jgi:hypothetical protein
MYKFPNSKNKDIIPRIFGGLSVTSGILYLFIFLIGIGMVFINPNWFKTIVVVVILISSYALLTFIDVTSNGIESVIKNIFIKDITGVEINRMIKHIQKIDDSKN